jgi:membrane protein YdbS with pleckstrin-like domain
MGLKKEEKIALVLVGVIVALSTLYFTQFALPWVYMLAFVFILAGVFA